MKDQARVLDTNALEASRQAYPFLSDPVGYERIVGGYLAAVPSTAVPSQEQMNQAFYVDVCNAERRLREFVEAGKALLDVLPSHWHDEPINEMHDLVKKTAIVLDPQGVMPEQVKVAQEEYYGRAVYEARLLSASLASEAKSVAGEADPTPVDDDIPRVFEEAVERSARIRALRRQCAMSNYHDHDGCTCSDNELLRRAPSPDVAGLEPVAWKYEDEIEQRGPLYSASQLSALEGELREARAENARNAEGFAFHASRAERERARAETAERELSSERARTAEVVESLIDVTASLAAAISLLERTPKAKKAAPSDKMFDQMLTDYRASLDRARTVHSTIPSTTTVSSTTGGLPSACSVSVKDAVVTAAYDGDEDAMRVFRLLGGTTTGRGD